MGPSTSSFFRALRFKRFIQATALHKVQRKIQIIPSWSAPRTAEEKNLVPCQGAEVVTLRALVADLSSLGEYIQRGECAGQQFL